LRGVKGKETGERWWEAGKGGWSGSLIPGLVEEISATGEGRVSWHFNTTVQPTQTPETDPAVDAPRADIIVYTAPSPQTSVLLPTIQATKPTDYLQSFALLCPTLKIPAGYPIYQRDPHPSISVISTGTRPNSTEASGLIIQATPQQLSLTYDRETTKDQDIRKAFGILLAGTDLLPKEVLEGMDAVGEKDWQVKRWKFAQIAHPPGERAEGEIRVIKSENRTTIIAGDGESERGGVEGAWYSGKAVANRISERLA
jgi:predicted NAD/FAD-dependent oxidoreductase